MTELPKKSNAPADKMTDLKIALRERDREIGQILRGARMAHGQSITRCASAIETSRRRYMDMEAGKAPIGIAELEVLMQLLAIPVERIWPAPVAESAATPVLLQAHPRERLHIIIRVQE